MKNTQKNLEESFEVFKKQNKLGKNIVLHWGDVRCGRVVAIGRTTAVGSIHCLTSHISYSEMSALMDGYDLCKNKSLK